VYLIEMPRGWAVWQAARRFEGGRKTGSAGNGKISVPPDLFWPFYSVKRQASKSTKHGKNQVFD
jgi:hypothetical protein